MNQWNTIYQREGAKFSSNLNHWPSLVSFFKTQNCKGILDLGCGAGSHALKLAKQGFEVTGFDISEEAIEVAKNLFRKKRLEGKFVVGSMNQQFPFADNSFDSVLSLRTINHNTKEQIEFTISEILRVLRPGGYLFLTTIKIPGRKKILGVTKLNTLLVEIIAPYTYKPTEGKETGIIHFMFNKQLIREMFSKFTINDLWIEYGKKHWERYYCLLAKKSASS